MDDEHQKCPICMDIPEKEIYQCVGGHIICHICIANLSTCPQCREPYGAKKIRNRILEQILDKQTFDCLHVEGGCVEKLKRQELLKHAVICPQKPIFLCKILGYHNCNFQVHPSDRKRIVQHFKKRHSAQIKSTNKFCLWHADFGVATEALKDREWNPILLTLNNQWCKDSVFMIAGFFDSTRKSVSWRCIQLCGNDEPNYEVEFTMVQEQEKIPLFKWTVPVSNLNSPAQKLGVKYVEIPLSDIHSSLGKISKIPIQVVVQPSNLFEKPGIIKKPVEVWTYSSEAKSADKPQGVENNQQEVHATIECLLCEQNPILGKRYKCLQCYEFNLCENCKSLGVHDYHIFATISTPRQGEVLESVFPQICQQLELASITAGVYD
ncbi:E3 ubiquitin-protein ligase sina [Orchesella cincta]|uniref:E3 ubiquitin-protein ligase sina n=1 Tax=Orchesella cincta TaxID=48709 RepID=A0A1D2MI29_ORCCI|nr:E3 ubiquitin-protein ligase sina [Orchesella cincta]